MNYDLIIWDFNGTLLDDVHLCYDLLVQLLKKYQLPSVSFTEYKDKFTFPVKDYYLSVGFSEEVYPLVSQQFMKMYQQQYLSCQLYSDVISTLQWIKNQNIQQICLSASQIDNLKQQLQEYQIYSYFDTILGLEHIYATSKLKIIQDWLQKNHFQDKKILCIGDSLHDYEVSQVISADCVLLSYGHFQKKRLLAANVPVFDNLQQLLLFLKKD